MRARELIAQVSGCVFALFAFVTPAGATMNAVMDKMFNSMINVTPGAIYQSQSAGIIAGPSIYERNKISTIQPLTFQAPRLKMGCEGIDAYLGSFSFINKDALVNMMRNIASNALPYAFKMAISTLCPKCDHLMSQLQEMADKMNKFNINSCKVAMAGVDQYAKPYMQDFAAYLGVDNGSYADHSEAVTDPAATPFSKLFATDPASAEEELAYNSAWKAMTKSKVSRWYIATMADGDSVLFYRMVMSFLGTIVTRAEDDGAGNMVPRTHNFHALIYFDDFLRGGQNKEIYHCDDEPFGLDAMVCLKPDAQPFQTITIPSIRNEVNLMLFGGAGQPGILAKITQRAAAGGVYLTVDEQRFVETAPGAVYAMLKQLSSNPESAKVYAQSIADALAVEMTAQLLLDITRNVRAGTAKNFGGPKGGVDPEKGKFLEHLKYVEDSIRSELSAAETRMGGLEKALQLAHQIRRNLNEVTTASARQSLATPSK